MENREELSRAWGRYVLAMRAGSVKEVKAEVLSRPGRYQEISKNLKAKEVAVGKGERRRRYVLCYNPRQAEREASHRSQVVAELEEELASHKSLSASQKWAIKLMASKRYGRYLTIGAHKSGIDGYGPIGERPTAAVVEPDLVTVDVCAIALHQIGQAIAVHIRQTHGVVFPVLIQELSAGGHGPGRNRPAVAVIQIDGLVWAEAAHQVR